MKNNKPFGLLLISLTSVSVAQAASLGTPEIIVLIIFGALTLAFIGGIIFLIYFLLKPKDSSSISINFTQPGIQNEPLVAVKNNHSNLDKLSEKIALPQQYEIRYVSSDEISRCEADNNYTYFFFNTGEKLLISKSLKEYSDLLKPRGFVRAHQSHLINPKFVKSWLKEDGGTLLMINGDKIPVSKPNRGNVKAILGD